MSATGGRTPFDQNNAATGPARVLYTDDLTGSSPSDLWSIIPAKNTNGEYPAVTGWHDFGLAADAPTYTHAKDTSGLEYQQPTQALFEVVTSVTRTFVAQVGEISPENLVVVENRSVTDIVTIAAAANKSAQKKLGFGLYPALKRRRIACVSYRPDGAGVVIEPDGTQRPPAVALILPVAALSTEDSEAQFERGSPTNMAVSFTAFEDPTITNPLERQGYWIFEQAGTISGT